MDIIVTVAAIIGSIAGFLQIKYFLDQDNNFGAFLSLCLALACAGFVIYYFYLGPKSVGDKFTSSLSTLDITGMMESICDDSPINSEITSNLGLLQIGSFFTGGAPLMRITSSYNPFTGEYSYTETDSFNNSSNSTSHVLKIRADGIFSFCISEDIAP